MQTEQQTKCAADRRGALEARKLELDRKVDEVKVAVRNERANAHAAFDRGVAEAVETRTRALEELRASVEGLFADKGEKKRLAAEGQAPIDAAQAARLVELETERDARLAPLAKRQQVAERERDDAVAELEAAEQRTYAKLEAEIVTDFYAAVGRSLRGLEAPRVGGFLDLVEAQRAVGERIARIFHMLDQRAQRELGDPLSVDLIGHALVADLVKGCPEALLAFGAEWPPAVRSALTSWKRVMKEGPALAGDTLALVVGAIGDAAAKVDGPVADNVTRRYEVRRSHATNRACTAALEAFDRTEKEERERGIVHTPPQRPSLLSVFGIGGPSSAG